MFHLTALNCKARTGSLFCPSIKKILENFFISKTDKQLDFHQAQDSKVIQEPHYAYFDESCP